jgi:lipopolysaccharide/colanic/teichoic acid biosynthesis glycosyltransferase
MRRSRLEWLYRLRQEPRRVWRRYVLGNIEFLARAAGHAFRTGRAARKNRTSRALKRLLDFSGAAAGSVALAPLMALTAAAIRLESRGPALFRQTRVGENGEHFTCLKFRSMHVDAEARLAALRAANDRNDGVTFKIKNDPRITRVGRFIRKFSIDELPQLWNVVAGEMSLVGPRPALPQEVAKYNALDLRRLDGKPGLTGPWQVGGRADISFQDMVLMDVEYLKTRSLWTDLRLILATPWAVIRAKGAY